MATQKFYVVIEGRIRGIYNCWEGGARNQVEGFSRPKYKSFATLDLARLWWADCLPGEPPVLQFEEIPETERPAYCHHAGGNFITYLIVDPLDGIPFYVGQTHNFKQRIKVHIQSASSTKRHTQKEKRIIEILERGDSPVFQEVDQQPDLAASLWSETEWVKKLAADGIITLNRWSEHRQWQEQKERETISRSS